MNLVVKRLIHAPAAAVWRAWTQAEEVMKWWGPDCYTCPTASMDVRVGGTSVVCMQSPQNQRFYNAWTYTAISEDESLEYIQNLSDATGAKLDPALAGLPPDFPIDQRNLVTLSAIGDQTEMTITQFDWTEGHMFGLAQKGLNQCMDRLVKTL